MRERLQRAAFTAAALLFVLLFVPHAGVQAHAETARKNFEILSYLGQPDTVLLADFPELAAESDSPDNSQFHSYDIVNPNKPSTYVFADSELSIIANPIYGDGQFIITRIMIKALPTYTPSGFYMNGVQLYGMVPDWANNRYTYSAFGNVLGSDNLKQKVFQSAIAAGFIPYAECRMGDFYIPELGATGTTPDDTAGFYRENENGDFIYFESFDGDPLYLVTFYFGNKPYLESQIPKGNY
ncbi:MAG: hypothetical protein ACI4OJ_13550 [Lachnospiraceae bacterium]